MQGKSKPSVRLKGAGKTLLKKHVGLIHSSATLGLVERRLFNWLLHQAIDQLPNDVTHELPLSVLKALLGWESSNNNAALEDALIGLMGTTAQFNLMDDDLGEEVWEATTMISYGAIVGNRVLWRYDRAMAAKLHTPNIYAMLNLAAHQGLESSHAYALYEQVARYKTLKQTAKFPVPVLRQLIGASAPLYDDFRYFNQRVIARAVAEINTITDVRIEPIFERTGRNVTSIQFSIQPNEQTQLLAGSKSDFLDSLSVEHQPIVQRMKALGCSDSFIKNALASYGGRVEHLNSCLVVTETRVEAGKVHTNAAAYLKKLISNPVDVTVPVTSASFSLEKSRRAAKETQIKQAQRIVEREEIENDRNEISYRIAMLSVEERIEAGEAHIAVRPSARKCWDKEQGAFSGREEAFFNFFLRSWVARDRASTT
jgi:hypothetical protein